MAQLTVRIDSKVAQKMYDMAVREMTEEHGEDYHQMVTELKRAALAHTFMKTGTLVKETDTLYLYEHPTKGDEAPLMAYHKASRRFFVDCGFLEPCCMDEVFMSQVEQEVQRLVDL